VQRPLATVVIGGIISSTILTLSSAFTMKLFFAAYTSCGHDHDGGRVVTQEAVGQKASVRLRAYPDRVLVKLYNIILLALAFALRRQRSHTATAGGRVSAETRPVSETPAWSAH
jgi:hypothetical protein